ncbi:MAG: alpha/beta fold hydrolase [Caulobacterales bacterium]
MRVVVKLVGLVALAIQILVVSGVSMSAVASTPHPRGQLVEVEPGRRMHIICAGPHASTRPTVLLEAGAFGFSADWAVVQDQLATEGLRSCAYDRAGLGFSDPGPSPRDGLAIAGDLEKLIAAAGEHGPFILCGHSMAGLHLRLFAGRNPQLVAGVVLVDATTPEAMDQPTARHFVSGFTQLSRLAAWGASAGIQRPLTGPFGDAIGLPNPAKAEKRWAFADAAHNRWAAAEVDEWARDADEALDAGPYDPAWPVAVVLTGVGGTRTESGEGGESGETKLSQEAPALASQHGFILRVQGANHATLLGVRYAGRIVEAILKVEEAAMARA